MDKELLLLVRLRLGLGLGLGEPGQEGLSSLANLARGGAVSVLLAGLGAPVGDHLLADEVVVVVELQDLDNKGEDVGVLGAELSEETLGTAEKCLLVALGSNNLGKGSVSLTYACKLSFINHIPASAYWRAWESGPGCSCRTGSGPGRARCGACPQYRAPWP